MPRLFTSCVALRRRAVYESRVRIAKALTNSAGRNTGDKRGTLARAGPLKGFWVPRPDADISREQLQRMISNRTMPGVLREHL